MKMQAESVAGPRRGKEISDGPHSRKAFGDVGESGSIFGVRFLGP